MPITSGLTQQEFKTLRPHLFFDRIELVTTERRNNDGITLSPATPVNQREYANFSSNECLLRRGSNVEPSKSAENKSTQKVIQITPALNPKDSIL